MQRILWGIFCKKLKVLLPAAIVVGSVKASDTLIDGAILSSPTIETEKCTNLDLSWRPHICHEYDELYSWRKNMSCGEISSFST